MKTKTALPEPLEIRHRPRSFDEVIGQDAVVRPIKQAIDKQKPLRKLLLVGPPGLGKTSIARIIGTSLTCDSGMSSQPCGKCRRCTLLHRGYPAAEFPAAKFANAKNVRTVINASTRGIFRESICIINKFHKLTKPVFDAFLEPLEQPPGNLVFVLCAPGIGGIPDEILSRCPPHHLSPVPENVLVPHLQHVAEVEGATISNADLIEIASNSGGFVRDAIGRLEIAIAES